MRRRRPIVVSFFFAIFCFNAVFITVPILKDDYHESDLFFASLLRGMGLEKKEVTNLFPISRLMNDSNDYSQKTSPDAFNIR